MTCRPFLEEIFEWSHGEGLLCIINAVVESIKCCKSLRVIWRFLAGDQLHDKIDEKIVDTDRKPA